MRGRILGHDDDNVNNSYVHRYIHTYIFWDTYGVEYSTLPDF